MKFMVWSRISYHSLYILRFAPSLHHSFNFILRYRIAVIFVRCTKASRLLQNGMFNYVRMCVCEKQRAKGSWPKRLIMLMNACHLLAMTYGCVCLLLFFRGFFGFRRNCLLSIELSFRSSVQRSLLIWKSHSIGWKPTRQQRRYWMTAFDRTSTSATLNTRWCNFDEKMMKNNNENRMLRTTQTNLRTKGHTISTLADLKWCHFIL